MSKNVLVLCAHPDDEVLGCGGTIARLADEGCSIELLTFTDGLSARGTKGDRYDQLEKSCKMLGIKNYACGQFPDNKIDSVPLLELCKFIENSVKNTPDIILTHHPDCLNIDHSLVYRATITSFRPQKGDRLKIYSYYVPSSTDYNPLNMFVANTYVDVKDYKDIKLKCLRECYGSEMREYPHSRSYKNVENLMKVSGAEVGLEYAEKFQLMRGII